LEIWIKSYDLKCYFFQKWTVWVNFKNHFSHKQKFEIDFLDLHMCGKLWISPLWSVRWKLRGVLVCGQLWISYTKINFEVLYLTQFSIFLEKMNSWDVNNLLQCSLQPLTLAFFNSISKFSTTLYFESFSTSF